MVNRLIIDFKVLSGCLNLLIYLFLHCNLFKILIVSSIVLCSSCRQAVNFALRGFISGQVFICPSATTSNGCSVSVQSHSFKIFLPFFFYLMAELTPSSLSWYVLPHKSPMRISAEDLSYLYLHLK